MRWNLKRLPLFRARAAQAFWGRSVARLRLRSYGLTRYPWPMQLTPHFVFAVIPARGQVHQAMRERAQRAARRCMRKTLRRQPGAGKKAEGPRWVDGLRRQPTSAQKKMTVAADAQVRVSKVTPAFTASRATRFTTASRPFERARARAAQAAKGALRSRARRHDFRDRLPARAGARFVAQSRRAASDPRRAPRRFVVMSGVPVSRAWARNWATRLSMQSASSNLAAPIDRYIDARQRRTAAPTERG